jgi:hypothetical protein
MSKEMKISEGIEPGLTIVMINVVHIKTDVSSSVDIILDRKIKSLDGIVHESLRNKFKAHNEKNKYYVENDFTQILIMEILKGLREYGWKLLTSNAFMHFASEKVIETSFYFEKYFNDVSSSKGSVNHVQPLLNYYAATARQPGIDDDQEYVPATRAKPRSEGFQSPNGDENSNEGKDAFTVSPKLTSLILDKTAPQTGPYNFMRRQTMNNGNCP